MQMFRRPEGTRWYVRHGRLRRLEVLAEGELDAIPAGAYVYRDDPIRSDSFGSNAPKKRGTPTTGPTSAA